MKRAALLALIVLSGCTVRPAFIPAPAKVFDHFQALSRPVRELPVGALWIEDHGVYGPGAAADNLVTLPGISGVTIDNDLAASLSLGFLQNLDLDPSLDSKIDVRLNDLTIVQVKDMERLEGPREQPRVYEAIRVGSATITTSKDVGVAIESRALEHGLPVFGRGSSGRRSTFSIEAKDVYVAVHIATLVSVTSKTVRVRLSANSQRTDLNGLTIQISGDEADCQKGQILAEKGAGTMLQPTAFDPRSITKLELLAPIGDGARLYDHLLIEPDDKSSDECAVRLVLAGAATIDQRY